MASEAEFLQGMQPPDIEEVKVISSLGGEARLNNSNAHANETRHSAEKLDEVKARLAIKRLLDQGLQSPIKVCHTSGVYGIGFSNKILSAMSSLILNAQTFFSHHQLMKISISYLRITTGIGISRCYSLYFSCYPN